MQVQGFIKTQDPRELLGLLEALYSYQIRECQYPHALVPNGSQLWLDSFLPTLGLYSNIFVLTSKTEALLGFIALRVKTYPKYLNVHPRGQIGEMFVVPEVRQQGGGQLLVSEAQKWFRQKNIRVLELNTVVGNGLGEKFWEKMGFSLELKQWSKILLP